MLQTKRYILIYFPRDLLSWISLECFKCIAFFCNILEEQCSNFFIFVKMQSKMQLCLHLSLRAEWTQPVLPDLSVSVCFYCQSVFTESIQINVLFSLGSIIAVALAVFLSAALLPHCVWSWWTEASGAAHGGGERVWWMGRGHPAGQVGTPCFSVWQKAVFLNANGPHLVFRDWQLVTEPAQGTTYFKTNSRECCLPVAVQWPLNNIPGTGSGTGPWPGRNRLRNAAMNHFLWV